MPSATMTKSCVGRKFTWFEGHGELVRRIPLIDREAYDHVKAYEHLGSMKSVKPMLRCKVYCLTDGIKVKKASRFGPHPPRKFYPYKDIHRFYAFADSPTIIILGCADPDKDTKHYELFKFDENQVEELCQLIERAHRDPMYRLVDDEGGLQRYQSSQSSLAGDTDTAQDEDIKKAPTGAVSTTEYSIQPETVTPVNSVDPSLTATAECAIEPELVSHDQRTPDGHPKSPLSLVPEHLRDDALFKKLCANLDENELLAIDMKYIEPNTEFGNQISNQGATYIFVAHHRHPEHRNQFNGTEDGDRSLEENTAEPVFTTTYAKVPTES